MSDERPREIKTILVAAGLTIESAGVVKAAQALASVMHAGLHAVHAFEPVSEHAERAVPGLVAAHDAQVKREFDVFAAGQGLGSATLHVERGTPPTRVLRVAQRVGADAIVAGRFGKGGPKAGRLGSVADRIVRDSPVSVLLVPPESSGVYRRLGVATDFSEGSDLALRRAAGLCAALGVAELTVLHCFEIPPGHHMIASWEDACRRLKAVGEQLAAEQVARVLGSGAGGLRIRIKVAEGAPSVGVPQLAAEEGIDLLIVAAYARTRAATALLGHTSERILRHAGCPVWVEKSPALAQGVLDAMRELLG